MAIPRRKIGPDGPDASVLALGSWHTYDRMHFEDAVEMVGTALEAGVNLFDVGNYSGFVLDGQRVPPSFTDVLFGRIMQATGVDRDAYLLSQKLWLQSYPDISLERQLDNALFRVGLEHADLVILGDIFTEGVDIPQITRDLAALVEKGKIRLWGVNNWSVDQLRLAWETAVAEGLPRPQMAQLKYSIVRRAIPEGEPFTALMDETGITIEASDVLEGGILAGNLSPQRQIGRDPGDLRAKIKEIVPRLREIAFQFGSTPAQLGIAFCLTNPRVTTVLFGASKVEQLRENLAAVELAERGDDLRRALDEFALDRHVVDPTGAMDAA